MSRIRREIAIVEVERQLTICDELRETNIKKEAMPLAMVDTYGCQQNESDSECLRGFLRRMGYGFTEDEFLADVVVVNSCAVREHAEMRVLGNVGALCHAKKLRKDQIIVLCGCMAGRQKMREKIKDSYPVVDILFSPHELWRFPELLSQFITRRKRIFEVEPSQGEIFEGLPRHRLSSSRVWLPVMYGCDNFCSYCVVPYVRGRERSRRFEIIISEAEHLIENGAKEITLLGQNVNSYGKDLGEGREFPELIRAINALRGDFLIRFMTSHPKDAGERLFRAMAESEKCARHLHLPVQSGSNTVLKTMNRGYTAEEYKSKIQFARDIMPDLVITTDIIVGFPGETDEDFADTLSLCRELRFDSMFTFIYSKRPGTKAADMPDNASRAEKQIRFDSLIELQNEISALRHAEYVGQTLRVFVVAASPGDREGFEARTNGGRLVHLSGDAKGGVFANALITDSSTWALRGVIV